VFIYRENEGDGSSRGRKFLESGFGSSLPMHAQPKCRELKACSPAPACLKTWWVFAASGCSFLRSSIEEAGWLLGHAYLASSLSF
jgi:hypothetical protein